MMQYSEFKKKGNHDTVVFLFAILSITILLAFTAPVNAIESGIYMSGDDPNNPLNYDNIPIINEIKDVTDANVDGGIFGTPHQMAIRTMKFIDNNIALENGNFYGSPQNTLHAGYGLCGDYAILASAMIATQNIRTRTIAICSKKGPYAGNTHAAIEVFYDDNWHFYDPIYSAYWIKNNHVLSFEELKNGEAESASLFIGNKTRYLLSGDGINGSFYLKSDYYTHGFPSGANTRDCPLSDDCRVC